MDKDALQTTVIEIGKSAPPVSVAGLMLAGISLSDWVLILTACWLLLQMGGWCWDRWKRNHFASPSHDRRKRQSGKISPKLAALLATGSISLLTAAGLITTWESGPKRPLNAYRDIVGVWTICDGLTRGVKPGQQATDEQCDQRLYAELKRVDVDILGCLDAQVPQEARAAVISLAYNAGSNAVCRSTMVRRLNAGDIRGGCLELRRWVYASGQRVQGLVNRREAELAVCLQGVT